MGANFEISRAVIGSAMKVPGGGDYKDFLMPGMFVMTMAFGFINTATVVVHDSTKGVIDRFRSMPMSPSAVVSGREFKGYDRETRRGVGTHRDLGTPDVLRECVRNVLQRLGGTVFIDVRRHGEHLNLGAFEYGKLNAGMPNPYATRVTNISQRLPESVQREGVTPA